MTLDNFNGTQVSVIHSFLCYRAGGAGLADQTNILTEMMLRPFTRRQETHHSQHRFVPPRTLWYERKREQLRPENKQIENTVATHS